MLQLYHLDADIGDHLKNGCSPLRCHQVRCRQSRGNSLSQISKTTQPLQKRDCSSKESKLTTIITSDNETRPSSKRYNKSGILLMSIHTCIHPSLPPTNPFQNILHSIPYNNASCSHNFFSMSRDSKQKTLQPPANAANEKQKGKTKRPPGISRPALFVGKQHTYNAYTQKDAKAVFLPT